MLQSTRNHHKVKQRRGCNKHMMDGVAQRDPPVGVRWQPAFLHSAVLFRHTSALAAPYCIQVGLWDNDPCAPRFPDATAAGCTDQEGSAKALICAGRGIPAICRARSKSSNCVYFCARRLRFNLMGHYVFMFFEGLKPNDGLAGRALAELRW